MTTLRLKGKTWPLAFTLEAMDLIEQTSEKTIDAVTFKIATREDRRVLLCAVNIPLTQCAGRKRAHDGGLDGQCIGEINDGQHILLRDPIKGCDGLFADHICRLHLLEHLFAAQQYIQRQFVGSRILGADNSLLC